MVGFISALVNAPANLCGCPLNPDACPPQEHGVNALHYYRRHFQATALEHLLHWIYSYRSLFTDPCSVCKRMTALDSPSDLLLPPLVRLYHHLRLPKAVAAGPVKPEVPKKEAELAAFHVGCIPKEELKSV